MDITQIRALAAKITGDMATLNRELAGLVNSVPVAPVKAPLLQVAKGVTLPAGGVPDLDKLKAMFPTAARFHGQTNGMWADPSNCLQVFPDGRFRVHLDRSRFNQIPNAALPLTRPVTAARIAYTMRFGPDATAWAWGKSGKIPGLARHVDGRFPGGGTVGPRNFSDCPAWTVRGNEIGLGPYIYGQHRGTVPDQWWGPDYDGGTLRWGAPIVPGLATAAKEWRVELDHTPGPRPHQSVTTFRVNGATRWSHTVDLLGPDQTHQVTHCHFRVMYGGDTLDYWPKSPTPAVTVIEFADFTVTEL